MADSVFVELRFWLLIFVSVVLPSLLYGAVALTRSIRKLTVFSIGIALVLISAIDVALLQSLAELAKHTASLADDAVFNSELSVALYSVPFLFGGLGVNIVSHLLMDHLALAERRHGRRNRLARQHPQGLRSRAARVTESQMIRRLNREARKASTSPRSDP